jgi:hypothetical protein
MDSAEITEKAIVYILENYDESKLSTWEKQFMESIADQWNRARRLSDRQKEVLGQIWDKQP